MILFGSAAATSRGSRKTVKYINTYTHTHTMHNTIHNTHTHTHTHTHTTSAQDQ